MTDDNDAKAHPTTHGLIQSHIEGVPFGACVCAEKITYDPAVGLPDSGRNCISNIHESGLSPQDTARRRRT